jgi:hypothetical protein
MSLHSGSEHERKGPCFVGMCRRSVCGTVCGLRGSDRRAEDETFKPAQRREAEKIFAARKGKADFIDYEFKDWKGTSLFTFAPSSRRP